MQNWRSALPFVAVLVVGLLIGVTLALVLDDDGDETTTTDSTTTSSSTSSTTSSTTTSSTTSSTAPSSTTTSTTTSSTTTTTTTEAPTAPLADTTTGELVGVAMGSPLPMAVAALTDRLGAPDDDTGWNTGCPLDGDPALDERWLTWGDLRVRFDRSEGDRARTHAEIVLGWTYGDTRPGSPVPGGPLAADVVMPAGITWGSSVSAVGVAIGETPEISDVFQASWVYDGAGKARWWVPGLDAGQPFTQASWDARDFCE